MEKLDDINAMKAKSFVSNSTLQLVLIYNFTLLSLSIPFLASGVSYKLLIDLIPNYFPTVINAIAIFLISSGSLITIISLIGFFYYEENSKGWIQAYMWTTFLIMNVSIVLLIILHLNNITSNDSGTPESYLQAEFANYRNDSSVQVETDRIQHKFSCCGIYSANDYKTTLHMFKLPGTCCKNNAYSCSIRNPTVFQEGCLTPLQDYIHHVFKFGQTITIILCVFMALFNLFAIFIEMKILHEVRMIELLL